MSPTPTPGKAKPGKKASRTGEALKKQAQKEIAERIATLDAEERGEAPPAAPEATPDAKPKVKVKAPGGAKAAAAPKPTTAPREKKPKRLGGLDAAAQVLKDAGTPMTAKAMMDAIREKKLWTTTGKTPEATIYAAIIREVAVKGKDARFKKIERGQFEFNGKAE